ncbi:coiled-coil domain-containing protein 190 [Elgaria multicarinata webbii]|uniref:coiled-coil domain-containing protein 190 n=1 Tax=Elgaria multicarinata webbii TaxID=159646 RepID=UPI002FCD49DC
MAEGEASRRWEAERRDVKRAEARLSHGLRSVEEAHLSYLNSVTKEQKRLKQELLKLQRSHSKQKLSVDTGHLSIKLALPLLSPQARQDYTCSHDATLRSRRKTLPRTGGFSGASQLHLHPQTLNSEVSGCDEDRKGYLPPLKAKDQNTIDDRDMTTLKDSITKQLNISAESVEKEEIDSTEDGRKESAKEEPRDVGPKGTTTTKLMYLPPKRRPSFGHERLITDPEAYAADGCLRTMYSRPDFLKAYAEARKARYIRHKYLPGWEKELSLQDIFGHKKSIDYIPQEQAVVKPNP